MYTNNLVTKEVEVSRFEVDEGIWFEYIFKYIYICMYIRLIYIYTVKCCTSICS